MLSSHLEAGVRVKGRAVSGFLLGVATGGWFTLLVALGLSGLLSWLPLVVRLGALSVFLLFAVAHRMGRVHTAPWQRKGMIPETRFFGKPMRNFFVFGAELGTGLRTYLPTWFPHVLAVAHLLGLGSVATGAAAALGWALARTRPLLAVRADESAAGSVKTFRAPM